MVGIYRAAGVGAFVSVKDEAELTSVDVSTLTLGTFAYVVDEDLYFQLVLDGSNDLIWQQVAFSGGTAHTTAPITGDGTSGNPISISPATESTAGSLSAADKTTIDGISSTYVPKTRQVGTTAPLTGGGALTGDLTLAISAATDSTAGSMSAADKTKLDALIEPAVGSALTDADATVNPASSAISASVLPASTLTANRVLTIGVSGSPVTNQVYQVIRRDLSAHTYTVKDDAGTTLYTFGASPSGAQGVSIYYNGTHYAFLSFYYVA